ncbi:LIM domain only protein 7b isoform X2 [Echeneis naucrates]|uniref:LIM domain only protein 7b isoform X2 n=1 Tax=Echeneis naucrates TaxID=173247 RepID=UPI0011135E57|nr:LIM domain only protein 7-like isoform X2 [Echeneis naucrates]
MEWRQQTSISCADAFREAQRWIEEVTGKQFGCNDFRAALENGVLLCNLINQLKPGIIKRVNRLSTPIAGLDNINVFLKACGKLGLNESQLFHPGDLQDLSTRVTLRQDEGDRRLKNVLITIYWLGRKAHLDSLYTGPEFNFKAFEGLLGLALSKALDEDSNAFVKGSGDRECWYPEREEDQHMKLSNKRGTSADSVNAVDSRGPRPNSEGCGSDAEAEQVFRMEPTRPPVRQNKGYVPSPLLRRKQEVNGRGGSSPLASVYQNQARRDRPFQVNPGWIWSKSLSDIPMVYPVQKFSNERAVHNVGLGANTPRGWNRNNTQKSSVAVKDSEAQWQDDFTKWKNRRRSTKSELRTKSQDREHVISQMTNGAVTNSERNEAHGRLLKRQQQSPCRHNPVPRVHATSPPSKSSGSDLRPRTRALLARSYATEMTFNSHDAAHAQGSSAGTMPGPDGDILGEETNIASLASDGVGVTTPSLDFPFTSLTQVKAQGIQPTTELEQPQTVCRSQISTLVTTIQPNGTLKSTSTREPSVYVLSHKDHPSSVDPKCPPFYTDEVDQTADAPVDQNHMSRRESQKTSLGTAGDEAGDQQAAGVYKYLSRATSWSGSASLPRGYRRSDGSSRLSSAITARPFMTKQSKSFSLQRQHTVDYQSLLVNCEKVETIPSPTKSSFRPAASHLRGQYQASIKQKKANQAKQRSIEQWEDGRGASVSKQTSLQTTDDHHQPFAPTQLLPQPYSDLQSHHNSSTLPSTKVDHSDMRVSLALKPNSRPDFGFQTHRDSTGVRIKSIQAGSPAELCQLGVDDEIVTVDGVSVAYMNYSQWKDVMTSALQTGSLTMDIRRYGNKDWSTTEGSHHSQPGQSRKTINLTSAAPVLIGCPDHHANTTASTATTVTKAQKFSRERDHVQEEVMAGVHADSHGMSTSKDYNKIIRKNQKRRAEFFNPKGGSESAISDLQVPSLSPSSSSWSWDHEEDRRRQEKWQEEQERLLQEQYRRDQERLEAEWWRAQQDVMGDSWRKSETTSQMTNGGGEPASTQIHRKALSNKSREEEQSFGTDELKEAGSKPQSTMLNEKRAEQDWAKSLSTPALASYHKPTRGDQRKRKGQPLSKAELDRQQILEEMKKKTQLLTDNSWIRQRSSSFYREPVYVGVPMKRYESLDNLDTLRQSQVSAATFSYPRPQSAAAGYYAPSRNSSSRYSTGAIIPQRSASMDPGSVWAATNISEELRLQSRVESETQSPTVSSAVSIQSVLAHPKCDQYAVLHITD